MLTGPRIVAPNRRLQRAGRVIRVEKLEPRVITQLGRHDRKTEVTDQRRIQVRADLRLEPQHAARDLRVAPRVVLEVALEL